MLGGPYLRNNSEDVGERRGRVAMSASRVYLKRIGEKRVGAFHWQLFQDERVLMHREERSHRHSANTKRSMSGG